MQKSFCLIFTQRVSYNVAESLGHSNTCTFTHYIHYVLVYWNQVTFKIYSSCFDRPSVTTVLCKVTQRPWWKLHFNSSIQTHGRRDNQLLLFLCMGIFGNVRFCISKGWQTWGTVLNGPNTNCIFRTKIDNPCIHILVAIHVVISKLLYFFWF